MALNPKRRIFIEEYLKCWNATEAARRAQYKHPNVKGCQLVKVSEIDAEIKRRLKEVQMEADEVLARISEIARAEYAPYILESGTINLAQMIADGKAHLIKGIKETKHGQEVTFHDSQKALTDMARRHGLFKDRTDNLNIDVSTLTDTQLNRIADGEDPIIVLADSR